MSELIRVPDIGGEGEVIELLIKPGDRVEAEQGLLVLESDKASMEVPSPAAGVVKNILAKLGDKLKQGDAIIELDSANGQAAAPEAVPAAPTQAVDEVEEPTPTAPAATPSTAGATREVRVPDIGSAGKAKIIEILVKPGDSVQAEQSLITLESDKASMEIPSPAAGVVESVAAALNDEVGTGDLILTLRDAEAATAAPAAAAPAPSPAASQPASPAPAAAPAASASQEVKVPDIGSAGKAKVIEVLVKPGDSVQAEQSLITLESDKASMEIPSPAAGVVESVAVQLNDEVSTGTPILTLRSAGAPAAAAAAAPAAPTPTPAPAQPSAAAPAAAPAP
ncbi:biotin/lipoyl-containing protein, partial [Azotobacter bryophylli]